MSAVALKIAPQPARPHLELVPPPARPTRPAAIYRRRRIMVSGLAVVLLFALAPVLNAGVSWAWHSAQSVVTGSQAAPTTSAAAPSPTMWTVRPGDTLWSIARSAKPQGDIRSVLTPLMHQYGGRPLQVGETLQLAH